MCLVELVWTQPLRLCRGAVNDQVLPRHFHERGRIEQLVDFWEAFLDERDQFTVVDVAGAHEQEFERTTLKQEGLHEVRVFGDHDPLLSHGQVVDCLVCRAVAVGEVQRMQRVHARGSHHVCQASWEVRVDQEAGHAQGVILFTRAKRTA